MKSFTIQTPKGPRTIGHGNPCFIVAEMSGNHHHDFAKAEEIVRAAATAGADAIKLQTYTPDTITIDSKKPWFMENNGENPSAWQGKSMYELYQSAYTPWEWHAPLQKLATELGLVFFSAPFDETAVDYLENLQVPMYKIASYEATDHILLKKVAATGKPVIMSVGYATQDEIEESVKVLQGNGTKNLALLHCITQYAGEPDPRYANLKTMQDIGNRFQVVAGFSDNDGGINVPLTAVAMGANILEKHMIIAQSEGGPDAQFSLQPDEFKIMVEKIRQFEAGDKQAIQPVDAAMGEVKYGPLSPIEKGNLRFRRSLFVVKDMQKGAEFTPENIRSIRPSNGLETKYYWDILGKHAVADIERGTPLSWELVEKAL